MLSSDSRAPPPRSKYLYMVVVPPPGLEVVVEVVSVLSTTVPELPKLLSRAPFDL